MTNVFIHCSLRSTFSVYNMFRPYMYKESTLTVKFKFQKNNHFRVSTLTRHETGWNDISYTLGAPEVCGSRSLCSGADVGWRSHSSPSSQVEEHQNLPQDRVENWRTLDVSWRCWVISCTLTSFSWLPPHLDPTTHCNWFSRKWPMVLFTSASIKGQSCQTWLDFWIELMFSFRWG